MLIVCWCVLFVRQAPLSFNGSSLFLVYSERLNEKEKGLIMVSCIAVVSMYTHPSFSHLSQAFKEYTADPLKPEGKIE